MRNKRFENTDITIRLNNFKDLRQWRKERKSKQKDLSFVIPSVSNPEIAFLQKNKTIPTITWIGHSTFFIQLNGINMITDPVWANFLGMDRRLSPPGLPISDLPPIDIVLISHSHYDHLHYSSLKKLQGDMTFYVPSGLGQWFKRKGFHQVIECNWWEGFEYDDLHITFVPAQHWTKRTLFDTNRSHWGGWIVQNTDDVIYFAGDSGYFKEFKEIGEKFAIDYCLMPIGAYEPEWFMSSQHVNPEEAIQAYIDTKSKVMIPMHYGAYRLADDTPKEALDRLFIEWEKRDLPDDQLKVMKLGETLRLK